MEAALDFGAEIVGAIASVAEQNRFAAGGFGLRGERDAVAVANLEWAGLLLHEDDFVAGGENRDARFHGAERLGGADLRGERYFGVANARARSENDLAAFALRCRAARCSGRDCAVRSKLTLSPLRVRVLDHHDSVGAGRDARASHDLHAGPACEGRRGVVAGFDFAGAAQSRAGMRVVGADSVAVARRAIEGRVFAFGFDFLSEDVADGCPRC